MNVSELDERPGGEPACRSKEFVLLSRSCCIAVRACEILGGYRVAGTADIMGAATFARKMP